MYDDKGNILLPGSFIPVAESLGFIDVIDRRMMQQVIQYQANLRQEGHDVSFTMNISGKHVGDERFLDFLSRTIAQSEADPQKLIFEITETAAVRDLDQAIRFINALKEMGCRFALDDFGVGFTSFVYLKEMHVDFIKIDGFFIRRLHEHRYDQGIVRAMTSVAKEMQMKTIAEFVERPEVIPLLKKFGVDYAQGFLIGKPTPNPNL
jgi:EAL domain-containing protein (putative c-di-GMP-specific phosphodiesterase class I)